MLYFLKGQNRDNLISTGKLDKKRIGSAVWLPSSKTHHQKQNTTVAANASSIS